MGGLIRMIVCPFHPDTHPSCAVYEDGFKCFGCGAHGSLKKLEGAQSSIDAPLKEKQRASRSVVESWESVHTPEAITFLHSRDILVTVADAYGVKENTKGTKLQLPCFWGAKQTGYQIRWIHQKRYKLHPVVEDYPNYCLVNLEPSEIGFIVEGILDALSLWCKTHFGSLVLLGTKVMPIAHIQKREQFRTPVFVYFDPDAHSQAAILVDRLNSIGIRAKGIYCKTPTTVGRWELRKILSGEE